MDRIIYLLYLPSLRKVIIFVSWDIFPASRYHKRSLHSRCVYLSRIRTRSTNPSKKEMTHFYARFREMRPEERDCAWKKKRKECNHLVNFNLIFSMYQLHLQNFSLNSIYIKINYSFEHLECGTNGALSKRWRNRFSRHWPGGIIICEKLELAIRLAGAHVGQNPSKTVLPVA